MQYRRHSRLVAKVGHLFQVLLFVFIVYSYFSANTLCILAFAFQLYFQVVIARLCTCFISVNKGRLVYIIYHQVKVTIIIKINIGSAIAVGWYIYTPIFTYVCKPEVGIIFKKIINYV